MDRVSLRISCSDDNTLKKFDTLQPYIWGSYRESEPLYISHPSSMQMHEMHCWKIQRHIHNHCWYCTVAQLFWEVYSFTMMDDGIWFCWNHTSNPRKKTRDIKVALKKEDWCIYIKKSQLGLKTSEEAIRKFLLTMACLANGDENLSLNWAHLFLWYHFSLNQRQVITVCVYRNFAIFHLDPQKEKRTTWKSWMQMRCE